MRILIRKNFLKIFCNAREQDDGALYHISIHAKEIGFSYDGIFNNAGWIICDFSYPKIEKK